MSLISHLGTPDVYASPAPRLRRRLFGLLPVVVGALGALFLIGLYLGIVTWAQDWGHARELLWGDRYFVAAIAAGFGTQVGLFVYLREIMHRHRLGTSAAVTATGAGTSSVAMVACCAHHVADIVPVLGLSGLAIFLNDYRSFFMGLGLGINGVGIALMLRLVWRERRLGGLFLGTREARS